MSDDELAPFMCQELVKRTLHDPDSAEFDPSYDYYREKSKDGVYLVQVTLRAKNGFNALRQMVVNCKLRHTATNGLQLVGLKQIR